MFNRLQLKRFVTLDDDVSAIDFEKCVSTQAGETVLNEPLVGCCKSSHTIPATVPINFISSASPFVGPSR